MEIRKTPAQFGFEGAVAAIDGEVVVAGTDEDGVTRVSFLRRDGAVTRASELDHDVSTAERPRLEILPGGDGAYIGSSVRDAAPHHGTSHVMMAIASQEPLARPALPRISVQVVGNRIDLRWTTPVGTVNGYRIEYRVDDGSWNELEAWYAVGENATSMNFPSVGTRIAFRMRAFNDAGPSGYSNVTATATGRRRAVR